MSPELPVQTSSTESDYIKSFRKSLRSIYNNQTYVIVLTVFIVLDLITLGLNTMIVPSVVTNIISVLDYIVQFVFILEAVLIIFAFESAFWHDKWKIMDVVITVVTLIPVGEWSQYSKVIRAVRVIRSIRVISHYGKLRFLIVVIGQSIKNVSWTLILQLIIFYCYSVVGTLIFGEKFVDWFGSIWKSLYSLFQIMTLESWSMGIARPVIAVFPYAWIYFISFVILSAFIMMNVVVGIIVNTIQSNADEGKDDIIQDKPGLEQILEQLKQIEENISSIIKEERKSLGLSKVVIPVFELTTPRKDDISTKDITKEEQSNENNILGNTTEYNQENHVEINMDENNY